MIKTSFIGCFLISTLIFISFNSSGKGNKRWLKGTIEIDTSWDKHLYLSHIPTMDKLHSISNEMIITKAEIDSLGQFQFDISFLPVEYNLYRLHLRKVGDSPNTLIIGGSDENYMFIILKRDTIINVNIAKGSPPFKRVLFKDSQLNSNLNAISKLIYQKDSMAEESDFLMSQFLDNKLNDELLQIADTASNYLVALFAIYHSNFEASNIQNQEVIHSIFEKWKNESNPYLDKFQKKVSIESKGNNLWVIIITVILGITIGYFMGKIKIKANKGIQDLSVQERKVYELLKSGASNQEIAEHFNIGLSTVKSHVSKILNKLKVKSRKDLME